MQNVPTYAWPVAIAAIVLALIQLMKRPDVPITIPPRARPWVALVLGIIGGTAAAIISGRSVLEAIVTGLTGGTGSIGVFELGSSVKPTPPAPPKDGGALPPDDPYRSSGGTLRVALEPGAASRFTRWGDLIRFGAAALFAVLAFGCTSVATVNAAVDSANVAGDLATDAAEVLDEKCVQPGRALRDQPVSLERSADVDKLIAKCDGPEAAYKLFRRRVLALRALILQAQTAEGVNVTDLAKAVEDLARDSAELATRVEKLRGDR